MRLVYAWILQDNKHIMEIFQQTFDFTWRRNQYDDTEEFYVDIREKGQREEKEVQEEIRRSREKLEAHDYFSGAFDWSDDIWMGTNSFRNLKRHDNILGDTLKAVSRQEADKPALSADAFKGLERLKGREAADLAAGTPGANPANQALEAGIHVHSLETLQHYSSYIRAIFNLIMCLNQF